MRGAPSVSFPVGRSRFAGCVLLIAWALGLAVLLGWAPQAPAAGLLLVAAVLVASGACSLRSWRAMPATALHWTGQDWQCVRIDGEAQGAVELHLDLQHCMLLRFRGACSAGGAGGATAWIWVEKRAAPADWAALRRAVYSRARTEAHQDAARPPAAPS